MEEIHLPVVSLLFEYLYVFSDILVRTISGSTVVECLFRDQGVASSSLTGVTVLCP